ncbi:DnaJ-like protein DjlA, putative [Pseudooceanicola batsensis HTCC2597]|uniref:DnaJ-like protein DjlA, putative n=1 Tax=Pseudooceanicola batsensis (strain ATCC BAA-863 / DSM 15984 / KCTC 12145 / HTCC2597) TaxID=252305 RepID=A3TYU6_PSEBH|nr:TerB family tellurite resistance protein [Pseudooceanicola batsensis]EAQ02764.1 DnaJ-like protein DjlA, putative [Pseudooceanicola batsensis HTCC2597]
MSVWSRISEALSALRRGESLAEVFDRLRAPPERSVAFTIAVIALGAKMAKADGTVTRDEVTAFREVFQIARRDEAQAARVFNLARQDVAGYDIYAQRVAAMFGPKSETLCNLMEGLFHIAMADGGYHPAEDEFLADVARIFGMEEDRFRHIRARFVPDAEPEPYAILGLDPDASYDEARAAWRAAVREWHPDRMAARGLPEEARKLAEKRLVDINRAWEEISAKRSRTGAPAV